jgi:hypothetical protein
MNAINPNHPVTQSAEENWHKIVALLVLQAGGRLSISRSEIESLIDGPPSAVVVKYNRDSIDLWMVSEAEAQRMGREEGGMPA